MEPDYRGFRIEVQAREVNRGWDADVRIGRTLSRAQPLVQTQRYRASSAGEAEQRGIEFGRQWVARHGNGRPSF